MRFRDPVAAGADLVPVRLRTDSGRDESKLGGDVQSKSRLEHFVLRIDSALVHLKVTRRFSTKLQLDLSGVAAVSQPVRNIVAVFD